MALETWHGPDLGRSIVAPLERCAELLDVDLATIPEAATNVEPYIRADGIRIWSLMLLERQLRPEAYGRPFASSQLPEQHSWSPAVSPNRW